MTSLHDAAPMVDSAYWVATLNPGSNTAQASRLLLVNLGEQDAQVTIAGTDDACASPGTAVELTLQGQFANPSRTRRYLGWAEEVVGRGVEGRASLPLKGLATAR